MSSTRSARRRRRQRDLRASSTPSDLVFSAPVEFTPESLSATDGDKVPSFDVVAYNGGMMSPSGVNVPVVIELSGVQPVANPTPVFLDHKTEGREIVGHAAVAVNRDNLSASGSISGHTDSAQTVLRSARNGFPWRVSVGGRPERTKMIRAGARATVNGRKHVGPFLWIKKFSLREISFVPIAADSTTSAAIAAKGAESMDPKFKEWLEANDFVPDNLEEGQLALLEAAWKASITENDEDSSEDNIQAADQKQEDQIAKMRQAASDELERQKKIQTAVPNHSTIQATAIKEGWSPERAELEFLRKNRGSGPAVHMKEMSASPNVIEAALCMRMGMTGDWLTKEGKYDEKSIEAASGPDYANYGFHSLCQDYLHANGHSVPPGLSTDSLMTKVRETYKDVRASMGFSTVSLPGILSNVLNKRLLQSFNGIDPVAQRLSSSRPVSDFKKTAAFRLTGNGEFLEIGPTGELKAMGLQEEEYENQAKTYGRIISISRNMLINDDLGALSQIPQILGRKAGMKLQKEWFTLFLALETSGHFSVGNGNLVATAPLAIDGLTKAEQVFLDQVDADGDPIQLMPAALLVPTALKVTAEELMNSTSTMMTDVGSTGPAQPMDQGVKTTVINPHVGKWTIETSPWLNAQNLANSSQDSWYLFASPTDLAAMEIVYLNGRTSPFIQSEDADFTTLGFHYRSYFDFGVREQDHRGAVKANAT